MKKIEHIGIAVRDLAKANELFTALLGCAPYKEEEVASEGVRTSFFEMGESKIELLAATSADSPIARFLEKRGEGIHHIAFAVEDIRAEMRRLKEAGFEPLQDEPRPGADGKWVAFFHPKTTGGVLIEICQDRESD